MRTFPIIRDLVTDVSFNYEMARQVPAFEPEAPGPDGTYRMMQVDVERGQEFRKCIECFMCQDVCHVIRDHEENKARYAGPRFFIRYMELESHPLDTNDRRQLIQERMGLGKCNITKCCTEVCPEHIKITDNGIIPLKERVVDAKYDPVAWLGRKILGRKVAPVPPTAATPSPDPRFPRTRRRRPWRRLGSRRDDARAVYSRGLLRPGCRARPPSPGVPRPTATGARRKLRRTAVARLGSGGRRSRRRLSPSIPGRPQTAVRSTAVRSTETRSQGPGHSARSVAILLTTSIFVLAPMPTGSSRGYLGS